MLTATTNTTHALDTPFALPGGATIKNRLVKAAMSEQLASLTGAPTEALSGSMRAEHAAAPAC